VSVWAGQSMGRVWWGCWGNGWGVLCCNGGQFAGGFRREVLTAGGFGERGGDLRLRDGDKATSVYCRVVIGRKLGSWRAVYGFLLGGGLVLGKAKEGGGL